MLGPHRRATLGRLADIDGSAHADLPVARRLHGGGVLRLEADRGGRHCRRRLRGIRREGPGERTDPGDELDPVHADASAISSRARTWLTPSTATSSTAAAPPTSCASAPTATTRARPPSRTGRAARPALSGQGVVRRQGARGRPGRRRHHRRGRRRVRARRGRIEFKLIVKRGGKVEETFDNVTTKQGAEQRRHRR